MELDKSITEELEKQAETDGALEEASEPSQADELEALRAEVKRLTAELEKKAAESEMIASQINELYELFPDTDVSRIPDNVWDSVREGNSLAAAYALHARKEQLREHNARTVNDRNAALSAGHAGSGTASEYFTPDEVRAMSQGEVRANYQKIIESMKKWN